MSVVEGSGPDLLQSLPGEVTLEIKWRTEGA